MQVTKPKVYIPGGDSGVVELFHDVYGCERTTDLDSAELVCFTGGADVDPELYNEKRIAQTQCRRSRDDVEIQIYESALYLKIPMIGICRGGQFLNVMNGGKLWQDVNNHGRSHICRDLLTQELHCVTSTHHQMMRHGKNGHVVATAELATRYQNSTYTLHQPMNLPRTHWDEEIVWYPQTMCLCFQPHPEYLETVSCTKYFTELLERFDLLIPQKQEA